MDLEQSLKRPARQRSDALDPFIDWLKKNGTKMGPVQITELPLYGCCVKANAAISEGDLLFSIPQKLMLTVETARASNIGIITG